MRNISMGICRELWLVPPSYSWGPLLFLWIRETHHISLYWSACGWPSIYCTKLLFQPHLSCSVMCLSHQFVSYLAMFCPIAGHGFPCRFGGKPFIHLYMTTALQSGGPGRSSAIQYPRTMLFSILTSPLIFQYTLLLQYI